jgi:hypothetical protein
MEKLLEKLNKLSLPVVIIIASIILGGFYYASQVNKQQSIERQQKREYIADRKDNCYALQEKEREQWSNVKSHYYDEKEDACIVRYTKTEKDYGISRHECETQGDTYIHPDYSDIIKGNADIGGGYCVITSELTREF